MILHSSIVGMTVKGLSNVASPDAFELLRITYLNVIYNQLYDQTGWGGRMSRTSVSRFERSGNPNLADSKMDPLGSNACLSQTNNFKIDTRHFLDCRTALLGKGKYWLAQCHDKVTVG